MTELVRDPEVFTELADAARARGALGLVPTMGALHAGHVALLERARAQCETVACTIYVNPLQFSEGADLARYPRDLAADLTVLEALGIEYCFAPTDAAMYPHPPVVTVDPGPLGDVLEGAARPGHFRGVATVVAKLFAIAGRSRAYFGEKDYQQLVIVRRLVRDLSIPVEIVACETIRGDDGLALSSRNALLSPEERLAAPVLFGALVAGAAAVAAGSSSEETEATMAAVVAKEPLVDLDYAVVRTTDLAAVGRPEGEVRLLIAARCGAIRLIDNMAATR